MTIGPPPDDEVRSTLERGLRARGEAAAVIDLHRAPYAYATSFPLEEITARLADGRQLRLLLKDLSWERLLDDARRTKPTFLYEPRRCIAVYENVLRGTGLGAECYGSCVDDNARRYWVLLERVSGVELWQIGDVATWEAVARWLARFHRRFAGGAEGPYLLHYNADFFSQWPARALEVLAADQRDRIASVVAGYNRVVRPLAEIPPTLVHGELYPSNVLVGEGPEQVWPVDWEMAGVGPPLLDVAALTSGWEPGVQAKLVQAYRDELGDGTWRWPGHELSHLLDACRLHYALQWLGWSANWSAPPEHARDWLAEALEVGHRLGLR